MSAISPANREAGSIPATFPPGHAALGPVYCVVGGTPLAVLASSSRIHSSDVWTLDIGSNGHQLIAFCLLLSSLTPICLLSCRIHKTRLLHRVQSTCRTQPVTSKVQDPSSGYLQLQLRRCNFHFWRCNKSPRLRWPDRSMLPLEPLQQPQPLTSFLLQSHAPAVSASQPCCALTTIAGT